MIRKGDFVYVIGEAGSNHDGKFNQACELIEVAAQAGCDAVKFQCIPPLDPEWMQDLQYTAKTFGIDFLATPFDLDAVIALDKLGVPMIKIASPELTYLGLLEAAAATGRPLLLSTGMAGMDEIGVALSYCDSSKVTLLQCTTMYPTPADKINLRAMETMRDMWHVPVGLSDHSIGIAVPIAAAALGATVIEKHFTLDRNLDGPDHSFAIEPDELRAMVNGIRDAERALGDGNKDGPLSQERMDSIGRRLTWT